MIVRSRHKLLRSHPGLRDRGQGEGATAGIGDDLDRGHAPHRAGRSARSTGSSEATRCPARRSCCCWPMTPKSSPNILLGWRNAEAL